jgi:hypothetical protein
MQAKLIKSAVHANKSKLTARAFCRFWHKIKPLVSNRRLILRNKPDHTRWHIINFKNQFIATATDKNKLGPTIVFFKNNFFAYT